jgi:hypothetical protein
MNQIKSPQPIKLKQHHKKRGMTNADTAIQSFLLSTIRERVGSDSPISVNVLAGKTSAISGKLVSGREVRQIVHNLRISGQPICSGPAGFYWPDSLQDIIRTADLEFRSEARSMLQTARKLREAGRVLFGRQQRLL